MRIAAGVFLGCQAYANGTPLATLIALTIIGVVLGRIDRESRACA